MTHLDTFLKAIHDKRLIKVKVNSKSKGIIDRVCVPFDFGPGSRTKDGLDRFHFYDLDSPDGRHNLSILPEKLLSIEITNDEFNPGEYVTWTPNWIVDRDWGQYS